MSLKCHAFTEYQIQKEKGILRHHSTIWSNWSSWKEAQTHFQILAAYYWHTVWVQETSALCIGSGLVEHYPTLIRSQTLIVIATVGHKPSWPCPQ